MGIFRTLVSTALRRRWWVVVLAIVLTGYGILAYSRMRVDVFPDLTAPSITIMAESPGMAPEETERRITLPIEQALQGMAGVRRVRSTSHYGFAIIWVDFHWGVGLRTARQRVSEKLAVARAVLPPSAPPPVISPETSVMGEILTIGLTGETLDPKALRDLADRTLQRAIRQVPGVAQVFVSGGEHGRWEVRLDQRSLALYGISADEVGEAIRRGGRDRTVGFAVQGTQEAMIRVFGQYTDRKDITSVVVAVRKGEPVTVGKVATVSPGVSTKRGEASINGRPGVIITILKQPGASTVDLTRRIEALLGELRPGLPRGVTLEPNLFNQSHFIRTAVDNVRRSLRDGAFLVILILVLFMMDLRSAFISLTALPLSILLAVLVLHFSGADINTMTLGGLTLAVGVLIDDAIIGVENSWRRLRENALLPKAERGNRITVILGAAGEILSSVVFANILIVIVFVPVFFIGGMEGRLIAPLGFAYIAANLASLLVSLTLTPALTALLTTRGSFAQKKDGFLLRGIKRIYRPLLHRTIGHPVVLGLLALLPLLPAVPLILKVPRRFLPQWNEGALNITAIAPPGTSLAEADRLGRLVEKELLSLPEVISTARKTGRTEMDEHAMEVSGSEIEVRLRRTGRSRHALLEELRHRFRKIKGLRVQIGQPLSHRIDHMLSGARSSLVVRITGQDLHELRSLAAKAAAIMATVHGIEDILVERITLLHQHHVRTDPVALAMAGIHGNRVSSTLERAMTGEIVGTMLEEGWPRDLVLTISREARTWAGIFDSLLIWSPVQGHIPLHHVARRDSAMGPNHISHEDGQRRILVTANFSAADTVGIVRTLRGRIQSRLPLPPGYTVSYGGQFESEGRSTRAMLWAIAAIILTIGAMFVYVFRSIPLALLLLLNLPFAASGGVLSLVLFDISLSVASLLGFIALFGVAVRNGIILVTHYRHLLEEGLPLREAVIRGSMERLSPILMTALTSWLALAPLVIMGDIPGNEIQAPMAVVILGGLFTSTILSLLVLPGLYAAVARHAGSAAPPTPPESFAP